MDDRTWHPDFSKGKGEREHPFLGRKRRGRESFGESRCNGRDWGEGGETFIRKKPYKMKIWRKKKKIKGDTCEKEEMRGKLEG